jgi:hypothetical protein
MGAFGRRKPLVRRTSSVPRNRGHQDACGVPLYLTGKSSASAGLFVQGDVGINPA